MLKSVAFTFVGISSPRVATVSVRKKRSAFTDHPAFLVIAKIDVIERGSWF